MSYDNRKPGEATVAAWQEAAAKARWAFGPAREAIITHYTEHTDFLMPGHITAIIRASRRQPARVAQLPASPAPPAQPTRIRELVQAVTTELGWSRGNTAADPQRTVACRHCGAGPGRPCARQIARGHRRGQWVPIRTYHDSRISDTKEKP